MIDLESQEAGAILRVGITSAAMDVDYAGLMLPLCAHGNHNTP